MKRILLVFSSFVFLSACSNQTNPQVSPVPSSDVFGNTAGGPPPNKNIALVFNGPGVCAEDCAKGAAAAAQAAGFTPKLVVPADLPNGATADQVSAFFSGAGVWVQPGGVSNTAYHSMSQTMIQGLISFVKNGGGYVGFCAGAFMATAQIGSTNAPGLGIFPGSTIPYTPPASFAHDHSLAFEIANVTWNGVQRYIFFQGGPYISNNDASVEVVARYNDGANTVAAARAPYGSGRVFISGPHPEAPDWWAAGTSAPDPDGSDLAYAAEMIRWAAGE